LLGLQGLQATRASRVVLGHKALQALSDLLALSGPREPVVLREQQGQLELEGCQVHQATQEQ